MHAIRGLAAALLVLTVAGCGDDGDAGQGSSPTTSSDGSSPSLPGDGGLVIEIVRGGGLVPMGFDFRSVPAAVVYDDGTVLAPGVMTLQYPGPAVLPVSTGQLDADAVAELVDAAEEAGLFGPLPDLGEVPIADAPTTTITVVRDGEAHVVDAYALSEAAGIQGLTDAQLAARAALNDFVTAVDQAVIDAGAEAYAPERYRVLAIPAVDGGDVQPNELTWPAELPAPSEGTCVAVDAGALDPLLDQATEITRWTVGEDTVQLAIRPVLPHEPDCP